MFHYNSVGARCPGRVRAYVYLQVIASIGSRERNTGLADSMPARRNRMVQMRVLARYMHDIDMLRCAAVGQLGVRGSLADIGYMRLAVIKVVC